MGCQLTGLRSDHQVGLLVSPVECARRCSYISMIHFRGTQLYDSSKGQFMDLSVLDVLQMFGRAGRPQYETHGVSYICTTSDKVDHYITAVNQQVPIESKFTEGLVDSLNAEISLGTVSTVDEGVRWLGYTFLHVRMRKNPMVYGLSSADLFSDPALGNRRRELIMNAAKVLSKNGMIQYDEDLGTLAPIDLGQISSKYYIRTKSIETFNEIFRAKATEADLLAVLSKSSEFQQVAVRESEADELKRLIENVIPCQVKVRTAYYPLCLRVYKLIARHLGWNGHIGRQSECPAASLHLEGSSGRLCSDL